ncbi:aminotransferase class V-fold PLP-dependent enzyme [Cognatishimia sp. WU-CL00825]|uniref:aminotransferase class V-fold PLP-dependent enzyme n=1 Tax=Cognatishimia sp. WU-CL00825 TaxID=3127658 RepID=UPI00310C0760
MTHETCKLMEFEHQLTALPDPIAALRDGLIGAGLSIVTPFGRKKLVYADYIASGRALRQVEDFVMQEVLPFYANSHTEQSYCGAKMTQMRESARAIIAQKCGANALDHAVIFGGSGATTGLNQLVHLFGLAEAARDGRQAFVLVGPYEHHSNILPWRESGATVIEIAEAVGGGVDLQDLEQVLRTLPDSSVKVGAFSAASNVTGVCTDPGPVTKLVKAYGGRVIWDYAGGGPYLEMSMSPAGCDIDALVFSPHKFIGGPGASGVLIVRRDAVVAQTPQRPGGGTVAFVNAHQHDYVARIEQREEGGTPNVIGDIRAALTLIVKQAIGQDQITMINQKLTDRAFAAWQDVPHLNLLAPAQTLRLPFLSFAPTDARGNIVNYHDFTRALSDQFGIQARGGCSCAGPYVHQLLSISQEQSDKLRQDILRGQEKDKPGFIRLNLSYLMSEESISHILHCVPQLVAQFAQQGDINACA